MSSYYMLRSLGLTNSESDDVDSFSGVPYREKGTFCSSHVCAKEGAGRRGNLVHVGASYLHKCPKCGCQNYLFHERVAYWQVERFHLLNKIKEENQSMEAR